MSIFAAIAALSGLAFLTILTGYYGFASVLDAVASSGWATVLVVIARIVALAGAGLGWWLLLEPLMRRRPGVFVGLRFIREAINSIFPVAMVGGDLIGARLLSRFGIAINL